jgi:WD40 repeat protein
MCGSLIRIQTYAEIMDSTTRKEFETLMTDKYRASPSMIQRNWAKKQTDFASLLPMILEYLPFGQCSKAPMVSTFWNQGTNLYREYLDVRGFVPWQVYRPHEGIVDSIMLSKNGKVYTGGDRRVLCSQLETGETLSLVTRDSGALPVLFEKDGELFCCSSNGSIRTYYQTESGRKMPMNKTMWDHTRAITCLMGALPSRGICAMHGIENHVCTMFTSSEDRTVKQYNLSQYVAVRGIYSNK